MIWFALAAMTAVAMLFALYPLLRRQGTGANPTRLAVFERQLDEIAADEADGVIGPDEANAARLEIKRRILAASDQAETDRAESGQVKATARGRRILLAATGLFMVAGLMLYMQIGSPGVPDHPYRVAGAEQAIDDGGPDLDQLVDRLIAHLDANPEDLQGWQYFRRAAPALDRQADLAAALLRATKARPDSPVLAMLYAESLILLGEGRIGPAAELALDRAETLAPGQPALRYYRALALMQQGQVAEARRIWAGLLENAPADAPWRPEVEREIARADRMLGRVSGPGSEAGAAIAGLPPEERQAAIRTMVEGLAARLEDEPDNLDGWRRLARSWEVLGEADKAVAAWTHVHDIAGKTGESEATAEAEGALKRLNPAR